MPQPPAGQRPPFNTYVMPSQAGGKIHTMPGAQRAPVPLQPAMQRQGQQYMNYGQQTPQSSAVLVQGTSGSSAQVSVTSPGQSSAPSPGMYFPSPSPQNPGSVPPSTSLSAGVPSPIATLNTPVNPVMMGGSQDQPTNINNSIFGSGAGGTTEEQAYLEKWRQLQKYIDPLKHMINRIENEEDRKKDLVKMTNLLNILTDSSKRLAVQTLIKCEQVLEKLELQGKANTPDPSSVSRSEPSICQGLIDAITQHSSLPTLTHSMKRTFQPSSVALHGHITRNEISSAKKRKRASVSGRYELSNLLQGEIARLQPKFGVQLDPAYHRGSKTVHLICKLKESKLPSVPAICVTIPENYPKSSPVCLLDEEDYKATEFLKLLLGNLESQLLMLPNRYSLSVVLDTWETSIRKACAPLLT